MRLPSRPRIQDGETLDSYLHRVCIANDSPVATLDDWSLQPVKFAAWAVAPDPASLRRFARMTGTPLPRLRQAELATFLAPCFSEVARVIPGDPDSVTALARSTWFWPGTSQLCPRCCPGRGPVAWQLSWRTPLVFACPTHQVLLVDTCPGCDRPFRDRHLAQVSLYAVAAGLCGNSTGKRHYCRQRLATIPCRELTQEEATVDQWVRDLLEGRPQSVFARPNRSATQTVRTVRALCGLILHRNSHLQGGAKPRSRFAMAPPRSAAHRALLLGQARRVLDLPVAEAARAITGFAPAGTDGYATVAWLKDHAMADHLLQEPLDLAIAAHQRPGGAVRKQVRRIPPETIPQLLWRQVWEQYLRSDLRSGEVPARAYASLCLARVSARTWAEAAQLLGLPPDLGRRIHRTGSAGLLVSTQEWATHLDAATGARPPHATNRRRAERAVLDQVMTDGFDHTRAEAAWRHLDAHPAALPGLLTSHAKPPRFGSRQRKPATDLQPLAAAPKRPH